MEENNTRELISGHNTINPFDDKYIVSGTASGNTSSGHDFVFIITQDLYIDAACSQENSCIITSGEAELTPEGYSTRYINYGDSICDCNFSIILNGDDHFVVIN